ncbi:MAG: DUF86 domain-containing protein [Halieaceae bacterium]|nr:DUF86 domain-containing protein [Halieaceae bacterium]
MSDASRKPREWGFYVKDMIAFARKVQVFTEGMDQDAFVSTTLTYDATLRNLELIGEAAICVPGVVRDAYPEIPWTEIIAQAKRDGETGRRNGTPIISTKIICAAKGGGCPVFVLVESWTDPFTPKTGLNQQYWKGLSRLRPLA